ncbi:MAG: prolipoprotein diacylglyceryl transferase [Sorangiineae bacterium]|nr:prolipoprotein diacylglyceryl transferase [Polyangiaceae bacterium]MEB2321387.1 prolipoprotein diacylglyceryl transferase [Sorangiineae bacterium]
MISEPLIPFIQIPDLVLIPQGRFGSGFPPVPFSIKPFGTLVAIAVYLGAYLAIREGKRRGLSERALTSFIFWVVVAGFVGGHVLDTLFYYPGRVLSDPASLLRLWDGLSSFGGFIGALCGVMLWKWRYRVGVLPYADVVASAFPAAWVFGRAGCAVAHDHPGLRSAAWFAVQYPDGGRFDLGLYEMLLTIPLAIVFLLLRRKPRPWGFYLAVMSIAYAPVRFGLDFLRARDVEVPDERYLGLTPAQWACFGLLAVGVTLLLRARRGTDAPGALAAPEPPERLRASAAAGHPS